MFSDYVDSTMPLPAEVEAEWLAKATDQVSAIVTLTGWQIDPYAVLAAVGHLAFVQCSCPWDAEAKRHRFIIYDDSHVGPKGTGYVAVPVMVDGVFVDLFLIDVEDLTITRVCGTARWLGASEFGTTNEVRLHRDPLDWLEAGCTGVCHIAPTSRAGLKALRQFERIICNDVHAALEAWEWAFAGDDEELSRFVIDADAELIRLYFERQARWAAQYELRGAHQHG